MRFRDRIEAGQLLAKRLSKYANRPDVLVLALPRGGVPVACEVARELNAPLDVLVVRKLGVPGQEELAMGATAGGVRVLNEALIQSLGIDDGLLNAVAARESREVERRERIYRGGRPAPDARGRTVIVVDDGIATGSTMKAAVIVLRRLEASRIVVAAPTAALSTVRGMRGDANEFITVMTPADFGSVGEWYEDFTQTTDEEVCRLLERAHTEHETRKIAGAKDRATAPFSAKRGEA
ncbi:MAG TPA: phosphoribosyltransferase [Verrucomicrobiae bacterium]|nr:phosphoribosyltransferase [Verrucomicrobiae bacterium]